jgi:hypothetical protein
VCTQNVLNGRAYNKLKCLLHNTFHPLPFLPPPLSPPIPFQIHLVRHRCGPRGWYPLERSRVLLPGKYVHSTLPYVSFSAFYRWQKTGFVIGPKGFVMRNIENARNWNSTPSSTPCHRLNSVLPSSLPSPLLLIPLMWSLPSPLEGPGVFNSGKFLNST